MRTTFIAAILCFGTAMSFGQQLHLAASSGYNWGANRSDCENFLYNKLVGVFYPQNKERFYYSAGKGMNFNLGLGYTTKRNIGIALEGSYLLGTKNAEETNYFGTDVFKKEIWGRFYRINSEIYIVQPIQKWSLRIAVGGLIGFGKMYLVQSATYNEGILSFQYRNEFSGGYSVGFKAGLSAQYPVSKQLNVFLDLNWINAYFSPTRMRVTKFVSGEYDYTDNLDVWDREVRYSNSVDKVFYSPDEPAHMLRERFAASSIGLQLGVQWVLWRKGDKEVGEQELHQSNISKFAACCE